LDLGAFVELVGAAVLVDVDVDVEVEVDVDVVVDVEVEVEVEVEVDVEVRVGDPGAVGASFVGAVAVRDGRVTERDELGRFEPPAHDAPRTRAIARSATEIARPSIVGEVRTAPSRVSSDRGRNLITTVSPPSLP
jgi:hypothetical protein